MTRNGTGTTAISRTRLENESCLLPGYTPLPTPDHGFRSCLTFLRRSNPSDPFSRSLSTPPNSNTYPRTLLVLYSTETVDDRHPKPVQGERFGVKGMGFSPFQPDLVAENGNFILRIYLVSPSKPVFLCTNLGRDLGV